MKKIDLMLVKVISGYAFICLAIDDENYKSHGKKKKRVKSIGKGKNCGAMRCRSFCRVLMIRIGNYENYLFAMQAK